MSVSDNIKAIRSKKGIPQAEVARRLEIEPSSYHRLENRGDKMTLEQVDSIAQALGVTRLELLTWGEDRADVTIDNIQALSRIEELEDRLKDKNKLIEKLDKIENDLDKANNAIADYLWDVINDEAIKTQVGEVELHYDAPENMLTIPMDLYVKSLNNEGVVDENYHTYGILLTDNQTKKIFHRLLEDEVFRNFVSHFYRINLINDDSLNRLFEAYTNLRYRLPKRKSNK